MAPGVTLIVAQPAFATSARHDPWPRHARAFNYWGFTNCDSGWWVVYAQFELVDGVEWYYVFDRFLSNIDAVALVNVYYYWTTIDGITGAFGECWNFYYKHLVKEKVFGDDWGAWLAAH